MSSTNDIRRAFLEHFRREGHEIQASAPLVPHNDPTLMLINAGMVPFKNFFTGQEASPFPTAASSQKCVRAGGKHNDLDNVGYTARHHTFFEMLGNFSFGDYFKDRAIELAWALITREWDIDPKRLWVTVYHDDDEAFALWRKIAGLPKERIIRIATKDNFWAMGDEGPCGPCSEIFFDHGRDVAGGPPGSSDQEGDRFTEIWNLVFMQYEQEAGEIVRDLPRPSIDTGMGLERIAAVLQGVHDNYDTDTFRALIAASTELTGAADPALQASHRVIADHLRACCFLIADGVLPANEGRGYVLRRIMRRAIRHARRLGAVEPLMHRLVPVLVDEMGAAYSELERARPLIEETLKLEESRFRQTLDNGLRLLEEATAGRSPGDMLSGEVAFKLYDTYGFPFDLTEDALRAQGLGVDREGFDAAMAAQQAAARAAWKGSGAKASDEIWFDIAAETGATEFIGYSGHEGEARILALVQDGARVDRLEAGAEGLLIVNQTPFYAESGGQIGDAGTLTGEKGGTARIDDVTKPLGKLHAHRLRVETGALTVGESVRLAIDAERRSKIRANHSATHLLHAALRMELGTHVTQKGSQVAPEYFRFDFSHPRPLSPEELESVETGINRQIRLNAEVGTRQMAPEEAVAAGALALFGEKYGDEVRVLSMGTKETDAYSVELCGGTHVSRLGDIQLLKIISEGAVASGVRRIEALTGEAACRWLGERDAKLRQAAALLRTSPDDVPQRVAALTEERRRLERELEAAKKALATGGEGSASVEIEQIGGHAFIGRVIEGIDPKALRGLIDDAKKRIDSGVVALVAVNDGRATVAVGVTDDLTGSRDAVALVRKAVEVVGGQGGGGRPDMAQGGGPEGGDAAKAVQAVRETLEAGAT